MALSKKDRTQLFGLLIFVAVLAPIGFWMYWRAPKVEERNALQAEIDSLQERIDSARQDLREGTVDALRSRVDVYERSLALMRLLVPTDNEVTNLIDQVSTRAQLRGVRITDISPLPEQFEAPFQVHRTRFTVSGSYDEIGEFLTDVASLERIMVPYEIGINPAPDACTAQQDARNSCLQATFLLRTFVKGDADDEGGISGTS